MLLEKFFIALRDYLPVRFEKQRKIYFSFFFKSGHEDIQSLLWRGGGRMATKLSWKTQWAQKLMVSEIKKTGNNIFSFHSFQNFFLCLSLPVASFRGEILKLTKIARNEMGSYLCIASNSVPPSVSKRISLNIHCKSLII